MSEFNGNHQNAGKSPGNYYSDDVFGRPIGRFFVSEDKNGANANSDATVEMTAVFAEHFDEIMHWKAMQIGKFKVDGDGTIAEANNDAEFGETMTLTYNRSLAKTDGIVAWQLTAGLEQVDLLAYEDGSRHMVYYRKDGQGNVLIKEESKDVDEQERVHALIEAYLTNDVFTAHEATLWEKQQANKAEYRELEAKSFHTALGPAALRRMVTLNSELVRTGGFPVGSGMRNYNPRTSPDGLAR